MNTRKLINTLTKAQLIVEELSKGGPGSGPRPGGGGPQEAPSHFGGRVHYEAPYVDRPMNAKKTEYHNKLQSMKEGDRLKVKIGGRIDVGTFVKYEKKRLSFNREWKDDNGKDRKTLNVVHLDAIEHLE